MGSKDISRALRAGSPYGPRKRNNAYETKHVRDKKYHQKEVAKRVKALLTRPKKKTKAEKEKMKKEFLKFSKKSGLINPLLGKGFKHGKRRK